MTFEAQLAPGGHRYRVRTAAENERAFLSATNHSRMVVILRKSLPVLALVIFAAYFISSRMNVTVGGVTASVSGIEVTDGKLRMVNPTLKGVDKKKGAYVVSADYADQDMKNPKLVNLHAIKAELTTEQKGWSRMQATRGLFDTEKERLVMQDDIRLNTSSGITGKLTHASLDMKNQILRSHQPVAFDLPSGTVRANALTLRSADNTLLFRGKVRVHIKKEAKDKPVAGTPGAAAVQIKAPAEPARVAPEAGAPMPTAETPQ
ncbi:MAG: LPS export ABC transporter periplasmic protein LptC [Methyloceanibacter sp.]